LTPSPAPGRGPADLRLQALLLLLTAATGSIDAITFLALGRVFVGNMTGNVVLLGFALAGAPGLSVAGSLTALAGFMAGAAGGGRVAFHFRGSPRRWLAVVLASETICVGVVAVVVGAAGPRLTPGLAVVLVLAVAMGLQTATARRLAVPDLTTTVVTMTLASLAADARLAGGQRPLRRAAAVLAMLLGALAGAILVFHAGPWAALTAAAALIGLAAAAAASIR
jgi:uncharacterized membrane protein YoaK (UPF0700 family)